MDRLDAEQAHVLAPLEGRTSVEVAPDGREADAELRAEGAGSQLEVAKGIERDGEESKLTSLSASG